MLPRAIDIARLAAAAHNMPMQAYSPFRTALLDRARLTSLSTPRPLIVVRDTLWHWAVIVVCFCAAATWPSAWIVIPAIVIIGVHFYGLYIIGHDGLHRRLFENMAVNDLWNDVMIMGSFGAITRLNRDNHMLHHRDTCLDTDPDRHKYRHGGKEAVVPFLFFLSGLANLVPSVRNVFLARPRRRAAIGYAMRDIAVLSGWQILLFAGLTWGVGWWAYPLLWLLPVYAFGYRADLTRVFCEHSVMDRSEEDADTSLRLITYRSNWLEKRFFAPHNMNLHAAHHLWPGIPYCNLPEADRLMRANAGDDPRLLVRESYASYLVQYLRWRLRDGAAIAVLRA